MNTKLIPQLKLLSGLLSSFVLMTMHASDGGVFTDDFNRPDTGPQSHYLGETTIGPDYFIPMGFWQLRQGILQRDIDEGNSILYLRRPVIGEYGFEWSADVFIGGYSDDSRDESLRTAGLVFHFEDRRNYYEVRFRTNRNSDAVLQFVRVADGRSTTLASQFAPNAVIDRATFYRMTIRSEAGSPNTFHYRLATLSGEALLENTLTDDQLSGGHVGFRGTGDIVARFDNARLEVF